MTGYPSGAVFLMPNTSLSRPLSALGDFTTTIFIPYASLSSQYRLSQPKPRRPIQTPAAKAASAPGRNRSAAPAPHSAAAASIALLSCVTTAPSLPLVLLQYTHRAAEGFMTGAGTGGGAHSALPPSSAGQKNGAASAAPFGSHVHYFLWLRITRTAPRPTVISITGAAGSLLTVSVSPRVMTAPVSGYFTPRRVTPSTLRSRGIRDR